MTVGAEPRTDAPPSLDTAPSVPCTRCGAPLAEDQDWCLNCGLARIPVRSVGSWVIPVAVVGTVVLLVLAAFAIALINLSSESNRDAATSATTATTTATTTPTATTQTSIKPFAGWPHGATGWTVVLASSPKRTTAKALATPIRDAGVTVGILHSSRFTAMKPGSWVVFSGHYPTQVAAQAQATALARQGHPGMVELVASAAQS